MTDKARKPRTGVLIAAGVAVVIVIALIIALIVGGDSDDADLADEQTTVDESTSEPVEDGDELPGAAVGNDQRHWPDPFERSDDSAHTKPGTHSVSLMHQRPVWTPVAHDGDLPSESDLKQSMSACDDKDNVKLDGKTQQQYVNARYLVVNDQAGPSTMNRGVPRGYAHSPQGAVLAAINMTNYGVPDTGDEIGFESEQQLWASSQSAQKAQDKRGKDFNNAFFRVDMTEPAAGFRVKECSDSVVVVETVTEISDLDDDPPMVVRLPMVWTDGDWVADLSGRADDQAFRPSEPVDAFTEVRYE